MWMRACSRLLTRIVGLARVLTSLSWALIFSCGEGEIEIRLMYEQEDDVLATQIEGSRLSSTGS